VTRDRFRIGYDCDSFLLVVQEARRWRDWRSGPTMSQPN
jgi:hypothetical protein